MNQTGSTFNGILFKQKAKARSWWKAKTFSPALTSMTPVVGRIFLPTKPTETKHRPNHKRIEVFPGRAVRCLPAPPQTRTSGFLRQLADSSEHGFAAQTLVCTSVSLSVDLTWTYSMSLVSRCIGISAQRPHITRAVPFLTKWLSRSRFPTVQPVL